MQDRSSKSTSAPPGKSSLERGAQKRASFKGNSCRINGIGDRLEQTKDCWFWCFKFLFPYRCFDQGGYLVPCPPRSKNILCLRIGIWVTWRTSNPTKTSLPHPIPSHKGWKSLTALAYGWTTRFSFENRKKAISFQSKTFAYRRVTYWFWSLWDVSGWSPV